MHLSHFNALFSNFLLLGTLFWSGTKRPPAPLEFDLSDPLHMEFLHALAVMRAEIYQIPVDDRPETLHQALNDVNLERFV